MINVCRGLAIVVTVLILYFIFAQHVNAVSETGRKDYKLMKGVTESTVYVVDSGNKNLIVHILRVQKGADVTIKTGYKNYYTKNSKQAKRKNKASKWGAEDWAWSPVETHAKEYEAAADCKGTVIAAASMDFLSAEGKPSGKLVMEGNVLCDSTYEDYLAIMDDGTLQIRSADQSTDGVQEAVGGGSTHLTNAKRIVSKGKVKVEKGGNREPRQAVGITADQTLVIVNVDGRDPSSVGATLYDLAMIMKQQGCREVLNMDGGGSAAFMTKRSASGSLKYRSLPGDGFVRNIASSLMIIKNDKTKGGKIKGKSTVSMKKTGTRLKKSSSGVYSFVIKGKKQKGLFMINGENYLFDKKGKGATKTIKLGNTEYRFNKGKLVSCTDSKAGDIGMGYCGAGTGEKNVIFAYNRGDKVLNVGINPMVKKNGKMKNWKSNPTNLPWYAVRADIKTVNIGDGIENIGDYFLYVSTSNVFDGSKAPKSALTTVSLPSSLKTIGARSFFNKPYLKNVNLPAKVTSVRERAFAYSGKGYIRFNSKKPPTFGKATFKNTKFTKAYVKNTKSWKKFVSAKKFKKYGFKKKVKYFR